MGQKLIEGILVDSETGEIINEVEEVEVVVEENQLPEIFLKGGTHIKCNIKQLETSLIEHLKSFDIEVTAETEKDASKQATELNKIATNLNKSRLAVAKEIKKPADELKTAVDGLIELVQEKRTDIIEKVEVFKSARFDKIKDLLEFELVRLYTAYSILEEYQTVDILPLVKEDSLGKTELSKKALASLDSLVIKCQSIQSNVKIRLLELPLKCQDLEVPLEEKDIKHIIKLDEFDYNEALDKLISDRLDLEERMEANRVAKEKREKEAEEARIEREAKAKEQEELKKQEEVKKVEKETGKKRVRIVATFEVEVNADKDEKEVLTAYRAKLFNEYKSLKTIELV